MIDGLIKLLRALRDLDVATAFNRVTRPVLTLIICVLFNVICAWAAITGAISIKDYVQTVGPMNGVIVGFWFGSRSRPAEPVQSSKEG
ncbi:hypothetical protein [Chitinibacter tainanensis]|uniref:hypothetical protein n=1 Tax=Chitinibacter tainanensis TaxID=230667 RepID=UPI00040EAC23|nr:hypothetical protein [Chitinibacter tainanensis]